MRSAGGIHVVGAGVLCALQRGAAGAVRVGARAGARSCGVRRACALRVARTHRCAHQRSHRRRRLPDRAGCDHAALPVLAGVLVTLGTAAAPFTAGAWLAGRRPAPARLGGPCTAPARGVQLAALALLYAECCERLCDAEAILYLSDVLVAFALEVCCVLVSAAWCALYARVGLLSRSEARLVALCALPRSLDTRWSMSCAARGMCRLPGVFAAPTQALLLAVLAPAADCDSDADLTDDDDVLPRDTGKLRGVAS